MWRSQPKPPLKAAEATIEKPRNSGVSSDFPNAKCPNYTESRARAPGLRVVSFVPNKIVLTAERISTRMSMQAVLRPESVADIPIVTNLRTVFGCSRNCVGQAARR
jgi:hypothetical protein